jgi:hypothetical protein
MAPLADESLSAEPAYRRLPGRGRKTSGFISVGATVNTIWLASDHLLLRESVYGLSETYKRFYFRDIQAFIVRRSPAWIGWISVLTALSLIFFFVWGVTGWHGWGWPFFSALCFVLTMVQLARGPSCVTYLVTAVQRELLGSLNRLRKAQRVLKILVPLIEEKQGKFDLATGAETATPRTSAAHRSVPPMLPGSAIVAPTSAARFSWVHLALFATTFLGGCVALWEEFKSSALTLNAASYFLAAIVVLAIITLIVQGRRRVNKMVAGLTWTITIGYIVAWILVFSIYTTVYSFQRARERAIRHNPPEVVFDLKPSSLRQMPGFDYVLLIYGACSAALGVAGIGSLFLSGPRGKEPPPLPAQSGSAPAA